MQRLFFIAALCQHFSMTMPLTDLGRFSAAILITLLTACSQSPSQPESVVAPTESPSSAPDSIAKISEIQNLPVFVRLLNAAQEQAAKEGMSLQAGETIRTQGKALAQIDLNSGLAFRLAGDAVLKLQPDNRLNLTAGDMITWIQPGKKVPTEIITPTAVAGIRGTTVFVKIPKDLKEGVLFFAWEGSVAVRLVGQTEEVLLKTAEEVRIKPGDRDIRQIRQRVRRMSRDEWRQKRQHDPLLRSFKKAPMSTLSIIDRIKPGQTTIPSPSASPEPSEKKQETRQSVQTQPQSVNERSNRVQPELKKQEKEPKRATVEKVDKPGKDQSEPAFRQPELPARRKPDDDDRQDRGDRNGDRASGAMATIGAIVMRRTITKTRACRDAPRNIPTH